MKKYFVIFFTSAGKLLFCNFLSVCSHFCFVEIMFNFLIDFAVYFINVDELRISPFHFYRCQSHSTFLLTFLRYYQSFLKFNFSKNFRPNRTFMTIKTQYSRKFIFLLYYLLHDQSFSSPHIFKPLINNFSSSCHTVIRL